MFRKKTVFVVFALIVLFAQTDAFGCICGKEPPVLDAFDSAGAVVTARLVSVERNAEKRGEDTFVFITSTRMVVEKVYKGDFKTNDEIVFRQDFIGGCRWYFHEDMTGEKFLFYLETSGVRAGASLLHPGACGRSRRLKDAADDLLYLDKMNEVRGQTRISGRAFSDLAGAPSFANLKIKIVGQNTTYETRTDENGVYEIYDLPPGNYLLEAQAPKGWKLYDGSEYSKDGRDKSSVPAKNQVRAVLASNGHLALDLMFVVDNVVLGRVVRPDGRAVAGVDVRAVAVGEDKNGYPGGKRVITDKNGEFELSGLYPGNYLLVVNQEDQITAEHPFGRSFYPGVAERERASVISMDFEKFIDVVIRIPKLEELMEIGGTLFFSDGNPAPNEAIEFEDSVVRASTRTRPDGSFRLRIVRGRAGRVFAARRVSPDEAKNCPGREQPAGSSGPNVRSSALILDGRNYPSKIKLIFPFPTCAQKTK